MQAAADTVQEIVNRSNRRFESHRLKVAAEADRHFAWLMFGQWIFGIVLAFTVSPKSWAGSTASVHPHVYLAVFGGALLSSVPIALAITRPGTVLTRHVIAVAQMMWSALLIHLSGGRIETHFHVFGSLGFIAYYRDWRVLVTATSVVVIDHLARGMFYPESVYGVASPEWWRFLEHAFWVVFCDAVLIFGCLRGVREMREIAERESLAESEWLKAAVTADA